MTRSTTCNRARRELLGGVDRVSGGAARHIESCPDCAAFAARFSGARDHLVAHRAQAAPDAGFAARVTAALPEPRAADALTWAAMRLLPAAVALALVLGVWTWVATSSPASLAGQAPTDDVLTWVLENGS